MDRDPMPLLPGQHATAKTTGKSFYQRRAERQAEIAAMMDRPPPPELEQVRWLLGTWSTGATTFATPTTPEYTYEHPEARIRCRLELDGHWLLFEPGTGRIRVIRYLTYDPPSGRWVEMKIEHPLGWHVMTAPGWTGNQLVFEGTMQLLVGQVELRHRLVKVSDDAWMWQNDEEQADGTWLTIDEHRYTRVMEDDTGPNA